MNGAEVGVVTRVDPDGGVYFTIERLTGSGDDAEYGPSRPCIPPGLAASLIAATVNTGTAAGHVHTITLRPLEQHDAILVVPVGGVADEWVVVGRIG